MALMTACPQCKAHYKIVPDQLRLHHGLVRCGTCQIVFDASKNLKPLPPETKPAEPEPAAQNWKDKPAVQALMQSLQEQKVQAPAQQQESLSTLAKPVTTYPATQRPAKVEVYRDDFTPPASVVHKQTAPTADHTQQYSNTQFYAVFDQNPVKPAKQTIEKSTAVRRLLYVLCVVLAIAAMVQAVVFWRYELVEAIPISKPLLVKACDALGCKVEPARILQPLVLDALTLKRLSPLEQLSEPASYEMVATVRNAGSLIVEAPVIELSLTNAQSQTIARRVLTVSELGMPSSADAPAVIAPQQDWNIKLLLMLDPQTVGFTGRLLLAQ